VKLSVEDLPMFFEERHRALAERVLAAAPAIAAADHDDRAAAAALAPLFDLLEGDSRGQPR
jgi:hypothetical protein